MKPEAVLLSITVRELTVAIYSTIAAMRDSTPTSGTHRNRAECPACVPSWWPSWGHVFSRRLYDYQALSTHREGVL